MEFEYTAKSKALQEKIDRFMQAHIFPLEQEHDEFVTNNLWQNFPKLNELKALAKAEGLWNLFLPKGCALVGIELTDDATDLPSFRHPAQAAYVLGPERASLSPDLLERCDYVIKIPTQFCVNVAIAGAIVMYDRVKTLGKFARPPVTSRGEPEVLPKQIFGAAYTRLKPNKNPPPADYDD